MSNIGAELSRSEIYDTRCRRLPYVLIKALEKSSNDMVFVFAYIDKLANDLCWVSGNQHVFSHRLEHHRPRSDSGSRSHKDVACTGKGPASTLDLMLALPTVPRASLALLVSGIVLLLSGSQAFQN